MDAELATKDPESVRAPSPAGGGSAPPESLARGGLNPSEAAIAWALVRFGRDAQACERLEGEVGGMIRRVVDPAMALGEAERFALVERWREEDRRWDRLDWLVEGLDPALVQPRVAQVGERWAGAYELVRARARGRRRPWRGARVRTRRAVEWLATEFARDLIVPVRPELRALQGFDLEQLTELSVDEFSAFARWLGIYQLAELTYRQSRRSVILLRQRLDPHDHGWFDYCYRRSGHLQEEERTRMRMLFNVVEGPEDGLSDYITRVGLYSIAAASVQRFEQKLRYVLRQLPASCAAQLHHQLQCVERTLQAEMTWQLGRTLDDFLCLRDQFLATTQPTPAIDGDIDHTGEQRTRGRT